MTERERLAEMIRSAMIWGYTEPSEIAERLIDEGVNAPPCKVGDRLWLVYTPKWPADPADKGKYFMREDGVQRVIYGAKGLSIETWNVGTMPAKAIGEKLFFSREEAEAALAERHKSK
jgi:hypothetical protein